MPTPIVLNDLLRCVVYTKFLPQPQYGLNIHYFAVAALMGAPTVENQVNSLHNRLVAGYAPIMNVNSQFSGVTLQKFMLPMPLNEPVPSSVGPLAGGIAGDPLPPDKCGIITWTTGVAGRRYRGRSYIPWPSESHNGADGLPTGAYGVLLTGVVAAILPSIATADGAGNGMTLVKTIYHARLPGGTGNGVLGAKPRLLWAVQHRRGDYGRPNTQGPF